MLMPSNDRTLHYDVWRGIYLLTVTNAPWRVGGVPEGILQLHVDGQT
jgi:hypothetical protein